MFHSVTESMEGGFEGGCNHDFLCSYFKDSFYHSLNEEKLKTVHEYNFDHPGRTN